MQRILANIPNLGKNPLQYIFETLQYKHEPNTLWLEFGVFEGRTINYISTFTNDRVYGFDSFEGLPEDWRHGFGKGTFNRNGRLPMVRPNVELVKGWFSDTLPKFLEMHKDQQVSFLHLDADLYSSTKFVLDTLKPYLHPQCILVFDELVNYPGYDGETGELRAWYEFCMENPEMKYEWIGMHGHIGMVGAGAEYENVALQLRS
jgi:Methyltransferase domain